MNVKAKKRMGTSGRLNPKIKFDAASLGSRLNADPAKPESKYQAEAEKPLDRIWEPVSSINTILIVDDADDLFGKRSSGKPN